MLKNKELEELKIINEKLKLEIFSLNKNVNSLDNKNLELNQTINTMNTIVDKIKSRKENKDYQKQKIQDLNNEILKQQNFINDLEKEFKQLNRKKSNLSKNLKESNFENDKKEEKTVSYTHLTLPTICSV